MEWNSSLDNNLQPGANSITYNYVVNAVYVPPGKGASLQNVQWDPEVEENPPANVVIKTQ